ncbi:hypothetical protein V8F20_004932 [Naviculisporaceae sp. PSN 640]
MPPRKTAPKINKSGFPVPDARYKPPRAEDEYDSAEEQDYSQPEPFSYRQSSSSSFFSKKKQPQQQEQQQKSSKPPAATPKTFLAPLKANDNNPGYEYVFDQTKGRYVPGQKKVKPVAVHNPQPSPRKRKSVSELKPKPEAEQKQQQKKQWLSFLRLPSWVYPALTAILFGLLVAHYIGGSPSIQQTGVESWSPNPITQVSTILDSGVALPRKVIGTGVTNRDRYKTFRVAVKEYCSAITKGQTKKQAIVKKYTRKTPETPDSWITKIGKIQIPKSFAELNAYFEYLWWRYGQIITGSDYPTREAFDICDDLQLKLRQLSGETSYMTTKVPTELEKYLTDYWPHTASQSLGDIHGELDKFFRNRAKKTGEKRDQPTMRKSNLGKVGADGAVIVEDKNKFGTPVWALKRTFAWPIVKRVDEEFRDFKKIAVHTVETMRNMDQLLGEMMPLADELLSKHPPEEWIVWTKLPEGGVEGIDEVVPGFGTIGPKSLGYDEEDLKKALKTAGLAQKSWSNVREMVNDFRYFKEKVEKFVGDPTGDLVLLEKQLKEMLNEDNWGRVDKVQGQQTLKWKYLEVSEDMVQDLNDKATRIEEERKKWKKEEEERLKQKLEADLERQQKEAEDEERVRQRRDRRSKVFGVLLD